MVYDFGLQKAILVGPMTQNLHSFESASMFYGLKEQYGWIDIYIYIYICTYISLSYDLKVVTRLTN